MSEPLVTLTTDFQQRDPFVASVKGVLYSRCPGIQLVDLSHDVPRGDLVEAALFVAKAIPYFPSGTIHLVAVGSGPPPILVTIDSQIIACPDNGLLTLLAQHHEVNEMRSIRIPPEAVAPGRQTMFARDIFAPAVARLAGGAACDEIGDPIDQIHQLELAQPMRRAKDWIRGQIIHVDRYGNLVTNVYRSILEDVTVKRLEVGDLPISGLSESYADVPFGKPLALFGSSDYLEIAYNGDRADDRLSLGKGIAVDIWVDPRG